MQGITVFRALANKGALPFAVLQNPGYRFRLTQPLQPYSAHNSLCIRSHHQLNGSVTSLHPSRQDCADLTAVAQDEMETKRILVAGWRPAEAFGQLPSHSA